MKPVIFTTFVKSVAFLAVHVKTATLIFRPKKCVLTITGCVFFRIVLQCLMNVLEKGGKMERECRNILKARKEMWTGFGVMYYNFIHFDYLQWNLLCAESFRAAKRMLWVIGRVWNDCVRSWVHWFSTMTSVALSTVASRPQYNWYTMLYQECFINNVLLFLF